MSIQLDENYPLEIRRVDETESVEILKHYNNGFQKYFVRIGPRNYFFNNEFLRVLAPLYNFKIRSEDIFVLSYPKAGTTLTQELVWMIANDCDYEKSNAVPLSSRFPYLEFSVAAHNEVAQDLIKKACANDPQKMKLVDSSSPGGLEVLDKTPSPRFIKSHMPLSMLSPNLLEKAKTVYVARDPRDVAVSYFHHQSFMMYYGYNSDFKAFWKLFKNNTVTWAPFFEHLKEAWALKDHPNILFLFYEELLKDLAGTIRRVAKFLNKEMTEEQVVGLCDHLSFDNFKKNKSLNYDMWKELGLLNSTKNFVRKGKAGGWRDYFDEEMSKEAELWIADNLRGTDIQLPH